MPLPSVADEPAFQSLSEETRQTIRDAEAEGIKEIQIMLANLPPELAEMLAWMVTLPGRFIRRQLALYRQLDEYEQLATRVGLGLANKSKTIHRASAAPEIVIALVMPQR